MMEVLDKVFTVPPQSPRKAPMLGNGRYPRRFRSAPQQPHTGNPHKNVKLVNANNIGHAFRKFHAARGGDRGRPRCEGADAKHDVIIQ